MFGTVQTKNAPAAACARKSAPFFATDLYQGKYFIKNQTEVFEVSIIKLIYIHISPY